MPNEPWTEITEHFDPEGDLKDLLKELGPVRIWAQGPVDDDGLRIFAAKLSSFGLIHACVLTSAGWICPCRQPQPCSAVVITTLTTLRWTRKALADRPAGG